MTLRNSLTFLSLRFPICKMKDLMHTSQEKPKDSRSYLRNLDVVSDILPAASWKATSVWEAVVLILVTGAEPSLR